MLHKLTSNSLLTIENIKTIIEAERPLPHQDDTLIVQFTSGQRIVEQVRVTSVIHDYREMLGWELVEQYGPIQEAIVVGRIGTTTAKAAIHDRFSLRRLFTPQGAIAVSGRNANSSFFANAWQQCCWDEEQNQLWDEPYISIATKQFKLGFVSTLEDLYAATKSYMRSCRNEHR